MYIHSLFFTAALTANAVAQSVEYGSISLRVASRDPGALFSRQDDPKEDNGDFPYDPNSICYSYGIDYQNQGSYFIDSRSSASFTAVSEFEGCVNNTYSNIVLVNDATGDQFACSDVSTTPDLVAQMSTCPITKQEMNTGDWAILALGNNGDGSPFAWERDFYLSVGIPETTTITPTVTLTQTTTPVVTSTSTSIITTTTTVPNKSTITEPAKTKTVSVTPKPVLTTKTNFLTRTSITWTKTIRTVTKTETPKCTVPPRPSNPDPVCRIIPTVVPIPSGVTIQEAKAKRADRPVSMEHIRKRFETLKATRERIAREVEAAVEDAQIARRSPDAPTITSTWSVPVSTTSTVTAPTSTFVDITLTTKTAQITEPPKTVKSGTKTVYTTLPPRTQTIIKIGKTTTVVTKTASVTWTYTTTSTASAAATSCKRRGGHFADKIEL